MSSDKIITGRRGEAEAVRFLLRRGFKVIEKNYRTRFGEIDIVADDRGTLVFIEVKTRRSLAFGEPKAGVDERKQRRVIAASNDYMLRRGVVDRAVRFDVISIVMNDDRCETEHITDAFEGGW